MVRRLGVLKRIDARQVWHYERDFTQWLKENISLLSEVLQMDLDLVEAEVPVGPFAADLVAKDASTDRWVVIENQLEPTDHGHLGQLLTYGAGTEAGVFVWITPEFHEEHRAALDWLNEHTDSDSLFFGIAIELVAVDDSDPAANFKPVSFPNEWRKGRARPPMSDKASAYAQFFGEVLNVFKQRYPRETYSSKPSSWNWQSIGIGRSGFGNSWSFTVDRRFRVELFIDVGDKAANEFFFDQLAADREEIERKMGHALDWDRLEGRRVCRISSYYDQSPISVSDSEDVLRPLADWAAEEMMRLRSVLRPYVHSLPPEGDATA
jgi:hypothetical protein